MHTVDVLELSSADRDVMWARLGAAEFDFAVKDDELVLTSMPEVTLPAAISDALALFQRGGTAHDALLLRNVAPAPEGLGATPTTLYLHEPPPPEVRRYETALLGILGLLGTPFALPSLYDGRIVQDVVPIRGAEEEQSAGGSRAFLGWHVEDAFSPHRCHYFGLLCVRGDSEAVTRFAAVKDLDLPETTRRVLREPRFTVAADLGHSGSDSTASQQTVTAVLSGTDDDPEICYDSIFMRGHDDRASAALDDLVAAITRASVEHSLTPGDLLVVDNQRVVHARTPFRPRFDGTDRWLMRTMVHKRR